MIGGIPLTALAVYMVFSPSGQVGFFYTFFWISLLYIAWTIVTSLFFMFALGFGAVAFGKRFRRYSIATMAIVFAAGAWTGTYASRLEANLPTPWAGVWERVNTTAFMVWIAVLAIGLLRDQEMAIVTSRRRDAEAA